MRETLSHWFRLAAAILRANPLTTVATVGLTLVAGLVPAISLRALQGLIDSVTAAVTAQAANGWEQPARHLALAALAALAGGIANRLLPPLRTRLKQGTERHLTELLLRRAAEAPLLAFEGPAHYDRLARAERGLRENIGNLIEFGQHAGRQLVVAVSLFAALAAMHPGAALLLLLAGGPVWYLQAGLAVSHWKLYREQAERVRRADYLGGLLTKRAYAQEVRLFGLAEPVLARWREQWRSLLAERLAWVKRRGVIAILSGSIGHLAYAGAVGLVGLAALGGRLSVGAFGASLKAAQELQESLLYLMMEGGHLRQAALFAGDYWAFVDGAAETGQIQEPAPQSGAALPAAAVRFDSVTFRYPSANAPTLEAISFTVQPGEVIALVGENGAGKSTLVKLLLGLYQPEAGRVLVDGLAVGAPQSAAVRERIAPVFQEYLRYALTAGENVGVGEVRAMHDQPRIALAAAAAGAGAVIAGLPRQFETPLGREFEGGHELSGGQWQRLAIGRAYMRRASLLVLDEPTAAMDPQAEVELFGQFRELVRGKTAFFISHRLGAARLADRILVLKEGRLVESGHHDELIARDGEYAALFAAQAHWYR